MTKIPAADWNALIDQLVRDQVIGATVLERGGWRHPWQTTVQWDGEMSAFAAQIKPGFIGGLDPIIATAGKYAPEATLKRLGVSRARVRSERVDAYLTERPRVRLDQWRAIGRDGQPTSQRAVNGRAVASYEAAPPFLVAQGAGQPPQGDEVPRSGRLVRATEIFLVKARFQTTTQWTFGLGEDGTRASFDLAFAPPPPGSERARIGTERATTPPTPPDPLAQLLTGYQDTGQDKLPLATVYLLGPESAFPGYDIGPDWTPHVQHHLFYNLAYDVSAIAPLEIDAGIGIPRGLGLGVADATIANLAGRINDLSDQLAEFLANNRAEGKFWTI